MRPPAPDVLEAVGCMVVLDMFDCMADTVDCMVSCGGVENWLGAGVLLPKK